MSRVLTLDDLRASYSAMHGGAPAPRGLKTLRAGDPREPLVEMGVLVRLTYEARKDDGPAAGRLAHHVHDFSGPRPVLAYTQDGLLVIVGGRYTVTPRGIVG